MVHANSLQLVFVALAFGLDYAYANVAAFGGYTAVLLAWSKHDSVAAFDNTRLLVYTSGFDNQAILASLQHTSKMIHTTKPVCYVALVLLALSRDGSDLLGQRTRVNKQSQDFGFPHVRKSFSLMSLTV